MMKNGGNKPLMQLLDVYSIDRLKINKATLYNSRLMDFYRKLVKILLDLKFKIKSTK